MARKGREFELAYADMYNLDKEKYTVSSPGYIIDKITGSRREIDVIIKYKDESGYDRTIAVECRDKKCGEDVKSIEQLIQKKEDMGVDYYVISTLYKFTENAIKKAKHYGVIIEKAEMLKKESIEKLDHEFFFDVYYIIPKLEKLTFLFEDNRIMNFKEFYNSLNILDKKELIKGLDFILLSNISVSDMIEKIGIKIKDFFKYDKNYWSRFCNTMFPKNEKDYISSKYKINGISYSIILKPFRLSLPINRSVSTFEVEQKKNKAFKVVFGNDEDNITIGYLDDKEIIGKVHLKPRKYHRVIGSEMHVNTIFPKDAKIKYKIDNMDDIAVNTIDYSEII